ncbi:MAG: bifunctional phosphoribosyl-AMP cyclohydrolase/phosphoribosyl-ATP diphosphatase HisIE [Chloroflexi bacterium]|nr:bifunctional phosphoribosyl-AMP cyclohydrolase/phosphoribosyl-ATP diphosphatase HisIE [Chloroflexota bacterium]
MDDLTLVRFDADGLTPAIVQDADTGRVLMLGYMTADALARTRATGQVWFWSRSRGRLWMKGETSGNTLALVELRLDCDGDALLVLARPAGPTCHTGQTSCFYRALDGTDMAEPVGPGVVGEVWRTLALRQEQMPEGSYTTYLLREGVDKIGKKVGEEAAEVIIAAKNGQPGPLASETADLIYHALVMLLACGVPPERVYAVLAERHRS